MAQFSALLSALKRKEGSSGLDGMGDAPTSQITGSKPSDVIGMDNDSGVGKKKGYAAGGMVGAPDPTADPDAMPDQAAGPDPTDQPDPKMDAKIVDVLQAQYPKIFAKISQMVAAAPDEGDDAAPSAAPPMMGGAA